MFYDFMSMHIEYFDTLHRQYGYDHNVLKRKNDTAQIAASF